MNLPCKLNIKKHIITTVGIMSNDSYVIGVDFGTDSVRSLIVNAETGNLIIETFNSYSYKHTPMVLVASHGPFTWGTTPEQAVYHSVILEYLAKMALDTLSINPDISAIRKSLIDNHFNRKHGENSYYGQHNRGEKK